jgi:3'-5' exonuclease
LFVQVLKNPTISIGFDSEARPQFEKGKGLNANALVQIAIGKEVLLYHCFQDFYYGDFSCLLELIRLFSKPGVTVAGMSVLQDVKKMCSDIRQTFRKEDFPNVIDLKKFALQHQIAIRGGLQGQAVHLCHTEKWKDKKVTLSNWEVWPLTFEQIKYAALDAYMSLLVYETLLTLGTGSEGGVIAGAEEGADDASDTDSVGAGAESILGAAADVVAENVIGAGAFPT